MRILPPGPVVSDNSMNFSDKRMLFKPFDRGRHAAQNLDTQQPAGDSALDRLGIEVVDRSECKHNCRFQISDFRLWIGNCYYNAESKAANWASFRLRCER